MNPPGSIVFLPGAGGGVPDLDVFRDGPGDSNQVDVIAYPGWRRYVTPGYSAEALIDELTAEIMRRIPDGPIRIVGFSIGGHFAYAAALRLQAAGREVAGVCAIDSMIIESSGPGEGWRQRALQEALELLRGGRLGDLARFARSRFWRALVRACGHRLAEIAHRHSRRLPLLLALDPILEEELSMRLLLATVAPWMASLDRNPSALDAPAILLRTGHAAGDDEAWRRRCPTIGIFRIPGTHHNLLGDDNLGALHQAFVAATPGWR